MHSFARETSWVSTLVTCFISPIERSRHPANREDGMDPLAEETRLLDRARICKEKRDWSCASARLDEYRSRFRRGVLAEEAMLLRIEIERANGDRESATQHARELIQANPKGPYARRASAILDQLSPSEGSR